MIYNLVKTKNSLPSKQEIKDFIRTSPEPIKLRKIARVFGVNARDRSALRQLLVDIGNSPNDWKFTEENSDIPELCIMEITSIDTDGIAIAKLVDRSLKNTKLLQFDLAIAELRFWNACRSSFGYPAFCAPPTGLRFAAQLFERQA